MKTIVFFGDSFAAHGRHVTELEQYSTINTNLVSYIDIVSAQQQATPIYMGFSSSSWWYSYIKLKEWISNNSNQWALTESIVMCLTSTSRPKISNFKDFQRYDSDKSMQNAYRYVQMCSQDFDNWAYNHFLQEVVQLTHGKKVIILPCFVAEQWISKDFKNYFAISAISLITISLSEFIQSTKIKNANDIGNILRRENDSRANHFNQHNNRQLAADIINQLDNYKPGIFMLNESAYEKGNNFFSHEYDTARELYHQYKDKN
jgi:hypothetical protein